MNINIRPDGAINRVHVSQNDIGRTLTFNLFNGSTQYDVPVGATVKIQGTKPSGFGFSETCTVSGNTVTVDTTEEMTDEFGYIDTELQITDSGDVIGTSNFILAIERNPHPDNITDGTQITAQSLEVRIEALEESALGGLTDEAKQALLNCFAHVAWIDGNGQSYYDALEDALYPTATLVSISAVYTQSGTVYDTDSLDDLKADLVVTAHYDNSSTATVTTYTLSGTLTVGTSTITVAYGGKTTTFSVTVTETPVGEELWINGYSDSNATQAKSQYAPFYLTSNHYTIDTSKSIVAIELNIHTIGNLSIGHEAESQVIGKGSINARNNFVLDETLTFTQTGKQKVYLTQPITLGTGECLAIGTTTDDAIFLYGANGTDKKFYYCGSGSVTENSSQSLGLNVYVEG